MKKWNRRIINIVQISLFSVLLLFCIGFTGEKQMRRVVSKVTINIVDHFDQYFITQDEIMLLVSEAAGHRVIGHDHEGLKLKAVENSIETHKFVDNAEVYRDLQGNLTIDIVQRRPIARIVQPNAPHAYIGKEGHLLPIIKSYTARVNLVSGAYASTLLKNNLFETDYGSKLLQLLQIIDRDPFWKAQLAQLDIDKSGNITMLTQVSKQKVEFGQPDDIEFKLTKLKVFYRDILPRKGWNDYQRVNLEYGNQIICE